MKNAAIINQVLILTLIILVGFYARKRNIINEKISKGLSDILLEITLPLLIISSFNYKFSRDMMLGSVKIFIYSFIIHIVLIFSSKIFLCRFKGDKQKILRAVMIFSNSGFMGYPVIESIYGKIGVFYTAIFNVPFNLIFFSYGAMLFSGRKDKKGVLKAFASPGNIAVYIGLIIFIFSINIPKPIYSAINMVGSMTTPLSMIIVGSMLAEQKAKEVFSEISIYYVSLLRLIAAPLISFAVLKLIHADALLIQISVMIEAMPGAVLVAVFAQKFNLDAKYASKAIFITTFLSIFTIPIVYMLL